MTSRERILATVRGQPVDRIPVHHLQFSGHAASIILGRPDVHVGGEHLQWLEIQAMAKGEDEHEAFRQRCERDAVDIARACGHDMLRLRYWRWPQDHRPVERLDDLAFLMEGPDGVRYTVFYERKLELLTRVGGRGRAGRPVGRLASDPEITEGSLRAMIAEEERQLEAGSGVRPYAELKESIERYPEYILRHGIGTVSVDMQSVAELTAVALWPDLFARLLLTRAGVIALEIAALAAAGLEINLSGHDFCTERGPSISPETHLEVVIPGLKVIADACHENGMYYFYTSDGHFWPVAADIFEVAGIDGWFETDRSAGMELRPLRERFPNVVFQGTIRSQVLHRGTRDDVIRETMECLEAAHDLGGIIVGASNLIMPGTPSENITAMLETIEANR